MKWTRTLHNAAVQLHAEPVKSDLDRDIHSRVGEYLVVPIGHTFEPHQISYTHCLLQRLDTYKERPAHRAFKRAWEDAQND